MSKRSATAICLVVGELAAGICLLIGIWFAPDFRELMLTGMAIQLTIAGYWFTVLFQSNRKPSPSDAD